MRFDEDTFRNLLEVQPFVPFTVETTGGSQFRVTHPETVLIGPEVMALMVDPPRASVVVLPYEHIASLVGNSAPAA